MRIVPYDPKYKDDFVEMNKRWISEMFVIEQEDIRELENLNPLSDEDGGNAYLCNGNMIPCALAGINIAAAALVARWRPGAFRRTSTGPSGVFSVKRAHPSTSV